MGSKVKQGRVLAAMLFGIVLASCLSSLLDHLKEESVSTLGQVAVTLTSQDSEQRHTSPK